MEPAGPSPRRLLLIDPDLPTQELLQILLEEEGYHVTLAETPDKAQKYLSSQVFHLIITELFFHWKQDPFQAANSLRNQAYPTPVSILTSWAITTSVTQARDFAWYLSKPFSLDDLLTRVAASLQLTFTPDQCQQRAITLRYLNALAAHDLDTMMDFCHEQMIYYPPSTLPRPASYPIVGKAAYQAYLEETLAYFGTLQFEDILLLPTSHGFALRYAVHQATPAGTHRRFTASLPLRFEEMQIVQVGTETSQDRWPISYRCSL